MKFTVSKAKLEEVQEIDSMLMNLIQDEREKYNNNINENYEVKEFYEKLIDNEDNRIFVAKENNIILGYVYGFVQDNGSLYNKRVAQLDALYVKEQYRGNGIAKSLMREFINWARVKEVSYVELSVCKDNTNAISLYEDEGFGIDKMVLRKEL